MPHPQHKGNTLTEYGLILGLVVLVSVGGLQLLGNTSKSQFNAQNAQLGSEPVKNYVSMKFSHIPGGLVNNGAVSNGGAFASGASADQGLGMKNTSSLASNTTSIENQTLLRAIKALQGKGSPYSDLSGLANLELLMSNLTSPEARAMAEKLSLQLHRLVMAEGDKTQTDDLAMASVNGVYTDAAALRDIYQVQQEIKRITRELKTSTNPEMRSLLSFAQQGIQGAQQFVKEPQFQKFINKTTGKLNTAALSKDRILNEGAHGYQVQMTPTTVMDMQLKILAPKIDHVLDTEAATVPVVKETATSASQTINMATN